MFSQAPIKLPVSINPQNQSYFKATSCSAHVMLWLRNMMTNGVNIKYSKPLITCAQFMQQLIVFNLSDKTDREEGYNADIYSTHLKIMGLKLIKEYGFANDLKLLPLLLSFTKKGFYYISLPNRMTGNSHAIGIVLLRRNCWAIYDPDGDCILTQHLPYSYKQLKKNWENPRRIETPFFDGPCRLISVGKP